MVLVIADNGSWLAAFLSSHISRIDTALHGSIFPVCSCNSTHLVFSSDRSSISVILQSAKIRSCHASHASSASCHISFINTSCNRSLIFAYDSPNIVLSADCYIGRAVFYGSFCCISSCNPPNVVFSVQASLYGKIFDSSGVHSKQSQIICRWSVNMQILYDMAISIEVSFKWMFFCPNRRPHFLCTSAQVNIFRQFKINIGVICSFIYQLA